MKALNVLKYFINVKSFIKFSIDMLSDKISSLQIDWARFNQYERFNQNILYPIIKHGTIYGVNIFS